MLEFDTMNKRLLFIIFLSVAILTVLASCKPINIFSPFVDPSKLGDDAKLDAGYNALADGDYDEAIDYFSDVIDSASGDDLTDAYIGRASAYMNLASPQLGNIVEDSLEGTLDYDNPGTIISDLVTDDEYDDFFDNVSNAADDYNAALDNAGSDLDKGILLEAYQSNMMAATGVGATKIATMYNVSPWDDLTEAGINQEVGTIIEGGAVHPFDIDTWSDTTPATNGLRQFVNGSAEETGMLGYLQNAYDALTLLATDPPADLDTAGMQQNINGWVTNGLGEPPLS
jgi:hypothetical protein